MFVILRWLSGKSIAHVTGIKFLRFVTGCKFPALGSDLLRGLIGLFLRCDRDWSVITTWKVTRNIYQVV